MDKDFKPSDFLNMPTDSTAVPRLPLGLMLDCCRSYFIVHQKIAKDRIAKKSPAAMDLILEPILMDQLLRACLIMYAQLPEEDRLALISEAAKIAITNPKAIPNTPSLKDLFQ